VFHQFHSKKHTKSNIHAPSDLSWRNTRYRMVDWCVGIVCKPWTAVTGRPLCTQKGQFFKIPITSARHFEDPRVAAQPRYFRRIQSLASVSTLNAPITIIERGHVIVWSTIHVWRLSPAFENSLHYAGNEK
jgi:hypothetical protein